MAYETTFNTPINAGPGTQSWEIDPWLYSCRIRVYGAGGGGERVQYNGSTFVPTAGGHGGDTTILGITAGGGLGGGRRADGVAQSNAGGTGGTVSLTGTPNWSNLGINLTSQVNGRLGTLNTGGIGGGGTNNGGAGSTGIFNFTSFISHSYNPTIATHYFNFSSADIYAGYPGLEGFSCGPPSAFSKRYHVGFNTAFVDDYSVSYSFSQQAAGGSTNGPFYVTGLSPNSSRNTLIHTKNYGWLSRLNYYTVNWIIGNWYAASSPPNYTLYTFWQGNQSYGTGSFVVYETLVYRAKSGSTNKPPAENLDVWEEVELSLGTLYRPSSPWGISSQSIQRVRYSYFDVWHCRQSGSTFVASQTFSQSGRKEGAVGRGGGGGAYAEINLTRQNLIDAGYDLEPYDSNGNQQSGPNLTFFVGESGGSAVSSGASGNVQIHWYEIPQVYISANRTEIIIGSNVIISWYVAGDGNVLTWTSGNINNGNLTSSETVSPQVSTTYSAQASGIAGTSYNTESSIRITVYQIPSIDEFEVPTSIDYGTESITLTYAASYCDISAQIKIYKYYTFGPDAGTSALDETIDISVDNISAEAGAPNSTISGTITKNISWELWGPSYYEIEFEIVGAGGTKTVTETMLVNIDRQPDNLNPPDTEDLFADQEPVYAPDVEVVTDGMLLNDIDIPVEIKANYPIQVDINKTNDWKNIRSL